MTPESIGETPPAGSRRTAVNKAFLLLAIAVVPFLPTLRGPFFWDDSANVEFNRALRTVHGLGLIWTDPLASFQYYPLTYSLFWIEFQLFELRPAGYHAVNLALHALNALLVWRAASQLRLRGAWWIAALFAVHPIQVETVGWISEQKNLLSTTFLLLTMLAWEPYAKGRGRRFLAAATLAFIAGLASKTIVLVLPVYLFISESFRRRALIRRWLPPLLFWIGLGVAAGMVTSWRETATSILTGVPSDTPPSLTFDQRVLLVCQNLWRYVGMMFCLEPFIPIPSRSIPEWTNPSAVAALVAAVGLVAASLVVAVRGRAFLFLALTFFAIQLGPTLGLFRFQFQCHSFIGDHFAYVACIGIFAVACDAWFRTAEVWRSILAAVVVAGLSVTTWSQSSLFADPIRLWRATGEANPQAWAAYVNLSDLLLKNKELEAAAAAAQQAVEIEPTASMGHHNLGLASARLNRPREAERHFREAFKYVPDDPRFNHNLANSLYQQERWREAVDHYRRAAAVAPEFPMTHLMMGNALKNLGETTEARKAFEDALAADPDFEQARKAIADLDAQAK
jgi:tetratricopeptide (TPR) repeat protein